MNPTNVMRRETCPTCKHTTTKYYDLYNMEPTLFVVVKKDSSGYALYYEPSADNSHPFWVSQTITMDYTNTMRDAIKSILKHKHLAGQQGCIEVYSDTSSLKIHSAVNSSTTGARFEVFEEYVRKALTRKS